MTTTVQFEVLGEEKIHCAGCESRIATALGRVPGVEDVQASAETQRVKGALYALLGVLLLAGRAGVLMVAIGPGLRKLSGLRGAAGLGVLFGLNIPACAAPLLAALRGAFRNGRA